MVDFIIGVPGLIISLVLLIFSGDALVRGSVSLAKRMGVSSLVIGLTVVAFGTSAPELIVSVGAAVNNHPQIALGNVIGSNIANVGLVLGVTAMLIVLPIQSKRIMFDWILMMASFGLLSFFLYDNVVARWEGILFVILLLAYIAVTIYLSKQDNGDEGVEKDTSGMKMMNAIMLVLLACGGLAGGAFLLVESASEIASSLGVSERVISITVVAFGTSVPELTASVIAAIRKQTEISIGNIIGSNLFNVLAVIGVTGSIQPIAIEFSDFSVDLVWMVLFSLVLMAVIYPLRKNLQRYRKNASPGVIFNIRSGRLSKLGGALLAVLYVVYVIYLF